MAEGRPDGLRWASLAFVALLLVAMVQGLTLQEVGIPGFLSVKFSDQSSNRGSDDTDDPAGGSTTDDDDTDSSGGGASASSVVNGSWQGARSDVLATVTQVENQSGTLRMTVRISNGESDSVTIPLFKNATAVDEAGRTYEADAFDSDWLETFAAGQEAQGTIEFEGNYEPGPGQLSLTFASMFGFGAPGGSLTVDGIDRP